jgi:exopolysaccharide production protein ExoQ
MWHIRNRRSQRAPRATPISLAVASGPDRSWLVDSKYKPAMTLMFYALLLLVTVPVPATLLHPEANNYALEPSLLYETLKASVLILAAAVLIWRFSFAALLAREVNRFLIAFIVLALLSTAWSIEPAITMRRFVLLCIDCVVCCACVMVGWYERRFQEILRSYLTALMIGSLIFIIIWPDLAKEQGTTISLAGAWHGLTGQKNALGHSASIATFLWLHGLLTKEVKFWKFALGFSAAVACLILSRSSTALFCALFSNMLLLLLLRGPKGKRRFMVFMVTVFAALIVVYSLAALNIVPGLDFLLQPFIATTGKDATFSGRTHIWAVLREHISHRPLLGTGYGAYWIGPVPRSPSTETMERFSTYYPSEGHNGYLDNLNDLGYVGLMCLLGFLLVFLRQSLAQLRIGYEQVTIYVALFLEELVSNMTSSEWFQPTSLSTPMIMLATFAFARALVDQRLRGQPQQTPEATRPSGRRPDNFARGRAR